MLAKVAAALQVPVEELISPPKAQAKLYRADSIPRKQRGGVFIRKLLPDYLQGLELDRMELPPGSQMAGNPHRLGQGNIWPVSQARWNWLFQGQI